MTIPFSKMTGTGNDFILINNIDGKYMESEFSALVPYICQRNLSIGADGLIFIEKSDKADFRWRYLGNLAPEVSMHVNAARCAARFAHLNGIVGASMTMETPIGIITAEHTEGLNVKVLVPSPDGFRFGEELEVAGEYFTLHRVNASVPHVVLMRDDIETFNITLYGAAIRYHDIFRPAGTNVNAASIVAKDTLRVRTYERRVEGESMACGTGAIATAAVFTKKKLVKSPVTVITSSGKRLIVSFENGQCYLEGEARLVFTGTMTEEAYHF